MILIVNQCTSCTKLPGGRRACRQQVRQWRQREEEEGGESNTKWVHRFHWCTQQMWVNILDNNKNKKTWNQRDTATVVNADLAVDVGSGVEQHLDHGLVPAHAGVHEGGHSLCVCGEGRRRRRVTGLLIRFPSGVFNQSQLNLLFSWKLYKKNFHPPAVRQF